MKILFRKISVLIFSYLFLYPAGILFAQAPRTFKELLENKFMDGILNPLVSLLIALAVVVFIYGVFKFIRSESDDKKQEGREFIIWGIIGLFVMISVWGLVGILSDTFELDSNRYIPTLPR